MQRFHFLLFALLILFGQARNRLQNHAASMRIVQETPADQLFEPAAFRVFAKFVK